MKYIIAILVLFSFGSAMAQERDNSYVIDADVVEYDDNKKTVIAKGNVEIFKEDYKLRADKVIYHKDTKKAFAYDNVKLFSPTGDVIKSDFIEVDNAIKEAIAHLANAELDKDNHFTAKKVHYHYPNITIFRNVSYTPCSVCEGKSPQWQIKSSRVHYEKEKDVSYLNNIFEVYGIPVFYFPYIRTPSPDSPPRSGFLFPTQHKYKNVYGYGMKIPYYFRIAEDKDLLYSPVITTKQGILHQAKFRHLLDKGSYNIEGNLINTEQSAAIHIPSNRYNIKGDVQYQFNDKWSLDGNLDRVSDKSYLPNYWGRSPNYLVSNASLHYIDGRDYGSLETYRFQGLRNEDSSKLDPMVLPMMHYHKELFTTWGKHVMETNVTNIARNHGVNSTRFSGKVGWDKTYYFNYQEISILRSLKMDLYNFKDKSDAALASSVGNNKNQVFRGIPELEVIWKYPLVSKRPERSFYLEPIIDLIVSPNYSKNDEIVNEDSQEIEISDSNLFSTNRYSGYDRVEDGIRVNYGTFASGMLENDMEYNAMIGQSYRVKNSSDYTVDSGLRDKHFSDYVGRIGFKPHKFFEMYYRGRVDSRTFEVRRNEIGTNFDIKPNYKNIDTVHVNIRHIYYDYLSQIEDTKVYKSLSLNARVDFYKNWYMKGEVKRNTSKLGDFLVGSKLGLGYKGECAAFQVSALKSYTEDASRNIKPTNGISLDLEVHLKNISQ
ncbi:MAG: LPS assembly protein LptD [Alphaproteobacteria bacterium]|nr:LPS assembly protein LptD [Alphaproteobacteria bacterium]